MIALALLTQTAPPDATRLPADIVVTAKSPYDWIGNVATRDGTPTCTTEVSMGDAEKDAIMCSALLICGPRFQPQIDALVRPAIAAGTIKSRADELRVSRPVMALYDKCMADRFKPALRALAKQRSLH